MENFFYSNKWKTWSTQVDERTCKQCRIRNGTIYEANTKITSKPPLHNNCRCMIQRMKAVLAGNATNLGKQGADWYLRYYQKLPDYYVSKLDAFMAGWSASKGNLSDVIPGKMIYGGIYNNYERKLPQAHGRIWHEADINYISGTRNSDRILFSNDGLIFVTYNHYETFIEVQ